MSDYADRIAAEIMPQLDDLVHVNRLDAAERDEVFECLADAARKGYELGFAQGVLL